MGTIFKVRSLKTDRTYGIVARDLEDLMTKGCQKLQIPRQRCRLCLYKDGTEVHADNFSCLEDNCKLIFLEQGQQWNGEICYCLNKIFHDQNNEELIMIARQMLSDETEPRRKMLLQYIVQNTAGNITAENRKDDQEWFEGLESRFKTKSDYMRFSCGRRMRNYLTEVKSHAENVDKKVKEKYCAFVARIEKLLQQTKFNGCYFDRTANGNSRLCTDEGWFTCQGAFDQQECSSFHSINPYGNKENRIVFSTWNLDHRIEKKRAIIPAIVNTVKNQDTDDNQVEFFYSHLFTLANLKLVHIACHKKTEHNLTCDPPPINKIKKRKMKMSSAPPRSARKYLSQSAI
ncbi:DNA fragmentation factor subunit beta isoform X1 [Chiloscyllium plagiosum]|uniref:DNA fragmentation factor subunit beta isoform X1 n=1 Tax=Chiloscyllium plagiosum TaxID=36176 RepID=UPI001CB86C4D|nr:DNA fragmentation factor subunit beta isoform X1 [Chiloscyllium plagiosum]XP_043531471.1 DNA fragmentation factor subunit beta isoform X1 [Chiloscyllium plagiosum]